MLLTALVYACSDAPVRSYHVFEEKDWFRGHLDDTECHSLDSTNSTLLSSSRRRPMCPIPNPYSMYDPLYVKLGSNCNDDGEVCCVVEEEDWCPDSDGEVICSTCGDCMYPQTVPASCCNANIMNPCGPHQVCCKCGPGNDSTSYECLEVGEECRECPLSEAPTTSPDSQWMTTPTPNNVIQEEL